MKKYRVGLVGIGAVGTEMIKVLRQRGFPASEIRIMARSARSEQVAGETFQVVETTPAAFDGLDIVLFAGTEGAAGASKQFGWEAVKRGCVVIDNGSDFRMDPRVPLVIPEINAGALENHQSLIANPNCSTIITLMGLAPLHRAVPLRRFTAVTFQSVSGTGRAAIEELDTQARAWAAGQPLAASVYPRQIAFNVLPQIGGLKDDMPGYTSEEAKMLFESRKILGAPELRASATCVRVPVFYAHSVALNLEFDGPMPPERAREILKASPGIRVLDDLSQSVFPTPLDAQHGDDVLVGRLRADPSVENGLALWTVGDNIRKGAAQNAVQIAETLIARKLI
jgi:aspartate-semialdehyde dehydrogenase